MKYYYSDPMAAQWMEAKYGMRFESASGGPVTIRDNSFHLADGTMVEQAYIAADSLVILKPQFRDVMTFGGRVGWFIQRAAEFYIVGDYPIQMDSQYRAHLKLARIIQRNNTAFHWPQQ